MDNTEFDEANDTPSSFLDLALRISTVPLNVVGLNIMVSMLITSFALGVAIPESAIDLAPLIALPLFLISNVFLCMAWLADGGGKEGGWWEAICHPWDRSDRLFAKRKAEREKREEEARAKAKADEAYEQERRLKMIELTDLERWQRITGEKNNTTHDDSKE